MYIFVSSIGRSGTRFLSQLMASCTQIPSFHSLEPHCTGDTYVKYNQGTRARDLKELKEKFKAIKSHSRKDSSFESSHIFLRLYAIPALSKLSDVHVIHLTRDPIEVARSYMNRDSVPGNKTKPWRLPLNLNRNSIYIKEKLELTGIQKNLVDWLENELRFWKLASRFTDIFHMYHSELNDPTMYMRLFRQFNIKFDQSNLEKTLAMANKLDQNKNVEETVLLSEDLIEAKDLIPILMKNQVDISPLRHEYYVDYQWIRDIIEYYDLNSEFCII